MKPAYKISLLPCPFCMGDDLDVTRRTYDSEKLFRIKCCKCGSVSGEYDNIQAAIIAWNNRPIPVEAES